MTVDPARLRFFLGGADLEMVEIRDLVAQTLGSDALVDAGLGWGAKAESYAEEIAAAKAAGVTPVLIELTGAEDVAGAISVDHHNERAGEPTSLEQVFALLGLPEEAWTRRMALVAANDRGHLRGMAAMGATPQEMEAIRRDDRAAQGITPDEEQTGRAALKAAHALFGGRLFCVQLPHGRMATVADPLRIRERAEGRPPRDLLIEAPGEMVFFGTGDGVMALADAFPDGWRGGDLPATGFWGCGRKDDLPDLDTATAVLEPLYR